jgi:hypothetical protein
MYKYADNVYHDRYDEHPPALKYQEELNGYYPVDHEPGIGHPSKHLRTSKRNKKSIASKLFRHLSGIPDHDRGV